MRDVHEREGLGRAQGVLAEGAVNAFLQGKEELGGPEG